jgi:hypothetical protein
MQLRWPARLRFRRVTACCVVSAIVLAAGGVVAQPAAVARAATASSAPPPLTTLSEQVPKSLEVSSDPEQAAEELAAMLDRDRAKWGGVLLAAYQRSGWAVTDQGVELPGSTDAVGPAVEWWEVWYVANLQHGLATSVSDWAEIIAAALDAGFDDGGTTDADELAAATLHDLTEGASSSDADTQFLASFISARSARFGTTPEVGADPSDVFLDPVSRDLLTRELLFELVSPAIPDVAAYETSAGPNAPASSGFNAPTPAVFQSVRRATQSGSWTDRCVPNSQLTQQGQDLVKDFLKYVVRGKTIVPSELSQSFTDKKLKLPGLRDQLTTGHLESFPKTPEGEYSADAERAKANWDRVNQVLLPIIQSIVDAMKLWIFHSSVRIAAKVDRDPLHRLPEGGQVSLVSVKPFFDPSGKETAYCLDFLAKALGVTRLKLPPAGPLKDAPMQIRSTGPAFTERRVALCYRTCPGNQKVTPAAGHEGDAVAIQGNRPVVPRADDGTLQFYVGGLPYDPDSVDPKKPIQRSATILVDVALKDSQIGQDLSDAWSTFTDTLKSGPFGLVIGPIRTVTEMMARDATMAGKAPFTVADFDLACPKQGGGPGRAAPAAAKVCKRVPQTAAGNLDYHLEQTDATGSRVLDMTIHVTLNTQDGPFDESGQWILLGAGSTYTLKYEETRPELSCTAEGTGTIRAAKSSVGTPSGAIGRAVDSPRDGPLIQVSFDEYYPDRPDEFPWECTGGTREGTFSVSQFPILDTCTGVSMMHADETPFGIVKESDDRVVISYDCSLNDDSGKTATFTGDLVGGDTKK